MKEKILGIVATAGFLAGTAISCTGQEAKKIGTGQYEEKCQTYYGAQLKREGEYTTEENNLLATFEWMDTQSDQIRCFSLGFREYTNAVIRKDPSIFINSGQARDSYALVAEFDGQAAIFFSKVKFEAPDFSKIDAAKDIYKAFAIFMEIKDNPRRYDLDPAYRAEIDAKAEKLASTQFDQQAQK